MQIEVKGFREFERAIRQSPETVAREGRQFLQDGMEVYQRIIWNNPWRMRGGGGGVPVAEVRGGFLRRSHKVQYQGLSASIGPSRAYTVPYAIYVHEGTRKMKERPWLDYAKKSGEPEMTKLWRDMLARITSNLAK